MPVLRGGRTVGRYLAQAKREPATIANIRMSHTGPNNEFIDPPRCLIRPNLDNILLPDDVTLPIVLAEAVVETEGTVHAIIALINHMIDQHNLHQGTHYPYPEYHPLALVSKVSGAPTIPNFQHPFHMSQKIWAHGMGCDNGGQGRGLNHIAGMISPKQPELPIPPFPYYSQSEGFARWLVHSS